MLEFVKVCIDPWMLPFTALLVLVVLYWLAIIVGAADLEMFEVGGEGALEGAADGAAEGLAEGAAEAAGEGWAEGVAEGAGESSTGMLGAILGFMNLGRIPTTVVLSVLFLIMWFTALVIDQTVRPLLGDVTAGALAVLLGLLGFIGIFFASATLTGFALKPFRKYFVLKTQRGDEHLVGKTCLVKTTKVDRKFGQAQLDVRGAPLLLSVICDEENALGKGSEAVIVGYDKEKNKYQIRPL